MMALSTRIKSAGGFVLLAAVWGLSFPAIRAGLDSIPPLLFAAFRYDVGGVLLLGYLVLKGSNWRPRTREDGLAILIAGAFLVAGNSLLFVGQQYTTSGIAAIIYALIPILTTGFAAALLPSEPITGRRLVGVVLGLVGVGVIAQPSPENLFSTEVLGLGFILAAAVSVALGSVLLRGRTPTLGVAPMTAWAMVLGGLFLHAGSVGVGEGFGDITPSLVGLVAVVYLAVFASAFAYVIYFTLLERFGPLEINLVSYVVPIFATLGGIALLNESLTLAMVGGFVLIAGGFAVLKANELADVIGVRV